MGRNVSNVPSLSQGSSSLPPLVVLYRNCRSLIIQFLLHKKKMTGNCKFNKCSKRKGPKSPTVRKYSDSMPQPVEEKAKVDTSDHGANCVCKDCRIKKSGKVVFSLTCKKELFS